MKKSSLIKKANSRHTSVVRKIGVLCLALLLCVVLYFVIPKVVTAAVAIVWYPFDAVRVWVAESGSSLPQYIRERKALLDELEALKIKVATEQGTENTIKKLQIENDELRDLAGAVPEARVLARVIGRPGTLPYDIVMLDRGRVHGIVENAPVFLGADQVIGFVSKVNEKTSFVTLVTTPGFTSSAYVIGPNIYTFAEGMGSGIMRVRVPQGIMLRTGDMVLLPAIDSGIYGVISYIETSATQPEQYGFVTTNIPTQSLYYVSVGKEGIVPHSFDEAEALVDTTRDALFTVDVPLGVLVTPETSSTSATTTATTSTTTVPR
jgi:cell shape-determining protein MreC